MAIQIPNPGTGNGQTGDNEFALWSKVKGNFENTTHAASKIVGTADGQVVLAEDTLKAAGSRATGYYGATAGVDCNNFAVGTRYLVSTANSNTPPVESGIEFYLIDTVSNSIALSKQQIAHGYNNAQIYTRSYRSDAWTPWRSSASSKLIYTTTTASGANVVVTSTGDLQRSTSSERYKDILADLVLDDVAYKNAMKLAPIVYRSTADSDNPDYHYYSFSAEALGAFDPAFTLWRDTETVTDADGNTSEQPLAERVAEGININALLAFSHAIAIKQDKMIRTQAEAIATLAQRIDAMATQ